MNTPKVARDKASSGRAPRRPAVVAKWQERIHGSDNYRWLVLIVVSLTVLMSTIEQGMLNVALPLITTELKTDLPTIQWVVASPLLVITALLLPASRLGDILDRKRVLIAGIGVGIVGSALCGVAQSAEQLILFRALQGVGGAMVLGNHQAIIAVAFPAGELGRATGASATAVGAGYLIGPSLGGFLVDFFGWRPAFYVRVVMGVLALAMALLTIKPSGRSGGGFRFDLWGTLSLGVSTTFLLLAVSQGATRGWLSPPIVLFSSVFMLSLLFFLRWERRAKNPLIDLGVFRYRLFSAASTCGFLTFFSLFAVPVLLPFYLVHVGHYTASQAGLVLSAQPLMMVLAAPFSGWMCERLDSRYLTTTGIVSSVAGLLLLSTADGQTPPLFVALEMSLLGLGMGLFMSPNVRDILSSLPQDKIGISGPFVPLTGYLGSSLSVGVFSAIFATRVLAYGGQSGAELGVLADAPAMVSALRDTFIVAGLVYLLAIPASLSRRN